MDKDQNQEWGFHAFLRGIILFGFAMLLLSLTLTGDLKYYVAPRLYTLVYVCTVIFFILSIVQVIRSTPKGQEEEIECDCGTDHTIIGSIWKKFLIYSIFIFPLITGFALPENVLDSSVATKKGVNLSSSMNSRPAIERAQINNTRTEKAVSAKSTEEYLDQLDQLDQQDTEIEHYSVEEMLAVEDLDDYVNEIMDRFRNEEIIIIDDENFLGMMMVMDLHPEEFSGKQIEVMGFVYREPGVKLDELVAARFVIPHCVADSSVYGLLVKGEETRNFENDTWVKITGTVGETEYNGWTIPMVLLEKIVEVPAPDDPYVYPDF